MTPHPPFTLDRHGNAETRWSKKFGTLAGASNAHRMQPQLQKAYAEGYAEKLLFTNNATLDYVTRVLESITGPLIIIINGDHGSGVLLDLESRENSCLRERFSPYLAIYTNSDQLRDRVKGHASSSFNLVNTYRLVFGTLFGQDIPLRENRSTFVNWEDMRENSSVSPQELEQACEIPW